MSVVVRLDNEPSEADLHGYPSCLIHSNRVVSIRNLHERSVVGLALAVILTGLSTPAVMATESKNSSDISLKNAITLYGKESYNEALPEFEKLTKSPKTAEVSRYYKALCLQNQRQYRAAKDEFSYLYYNAKDKNIRYKSWEALKNLLLLSSKNQASKIAKTKDPGADAWVTPTAGYGRSGPPPTSTLEVTIIPTSCGRRGR